MAAYFEAEDPWVQTRYGTKFYPLNPTTAMIDIQDIAHALSMKCRFNGHCAEFVSVAEHSVMVYDILANTYKVTDPVILLQGLLHDAGEAYLCDVPKPIKHVLVGFLGLENGIMDKAMEKFGVTTVGGELPSVVHEADYLGGIYEFSQNMMHVNKDLLPFELVSKEDTPAYGWLNYYGPTRARARFLGVFQTLFKSMK